MLTPERPAAIRHEEGTVEPDFYTDPVTGVIYWRDGKGILRPRVLTNEEGEVVGYEQAAGWFSGRVNG